MFPSTPRLIFPLPSFAPSPLVLHTLQALMNQHLQEGLIANALPASDLASLGQVRCGQAQCNLNTGGTGQIGHQL